jgi:DNA recombination protein RmuC
VNAVPVLLLGLLVGLALGAAGAWLLAGARARATAADASAMVRADAAGARAERTAAQQRLEGLAAEHARALERLRQAEGAAATATAALHAEREAGVRREELLTARDAELKGAFQALSADALARNAEQFVTLAEGRLREATTALHAKADGDAAVRAAAIGRLLDPMASALQRVEGQLRTVEKDRESAYAGLREQVSAMRTSSEQLRGETKQLVNALRAPQVRGRWGELQLERVVELAGMVEHCDFSTQVTAQGSDGGVRPDLVVHLAGGKQVVVDAKVPFAAYLEAVESPDPARHAERLAAHARQLRQHVDALAAKAYWFVPGDPFLEAALQADPGLLEHAFAANVVIATPTTLIALLRTIAYSWRQEALARNAAAVHQLGRELHGRLATMGTHVAKLGRSLDGAVESYNRTVSSLEARVLVTARKLTELQVADGDLEAPAQVERGPRTISAPELLASAGESLVALHEIPLPERRSDGGSDPGRATVNG